MYWWVQKVPTVRERGRGDEGAGARARWAKARWARARGRGRGGKGAGARVRWWVRRAARAPCSTASGSRDSQGCARSGTRASGKTRHETGRVSAGVPPGAAPRCTPRRGKSTRLRCMCEESARAFFQLVAANHQAARGTRGPEQHKLPAFSALWLWDPWPRACHVLVAPRQPRQPTVVAALVLATLCHAATGPAAHASHTAQADGRTLQRT